MLEIKNFDVYGFENAIRGARNPMNSWDRMDSEFQMKWKNPYDDDDMEGEIVLDIGPNDMDLLKRLNAGGPVHAKYRRMIVAYMDITAPLYWWKEFDTYKVGTVANSCSTMHKIHAKEFTLSDFSYDHLLRLEEIVKPDSSDKEKMLELVFNDNPLIMTDEGSYWSPLGILKLTISMLNKCRRLYLETKDKSYWWQMIQLLPSSYNQKRTVMVNYEVLHSMYRDRKDHKLDCWHQFCNFIEDNAPYAEELICCE